MNMKELPGVVGAIILFAVLVAVLVVACFGIGACCGTLTDSGKAVQLLRDLGYSDIQIIHRDTWFVDFKGGASEDNALYVIRATNPSGKEVTVQVFMGWPWKGATIRSY